MERSGDHHSNNSTHKSPSITLRKTGKSDSFNILNLRSVSYTNKSSGTENIDSLTQAGVPRGPHVPITHPNTTTYI